MYIQTKKWLKFKEVHLNLSFTISPPGNPSDTICHQYKDILFGELDEFSKYFVRSYLLFGQIVRVSNTNQH